MNDIPPPRESGAKPDALRSHPKIGFYTNFPVVILMLMPALLGYGFIAFDVINAGGLRPVIFDLSWLFFAFTLVAASILSKAPVIEEARKLSKVYLTIFVLFACVWAYTTVTIAPSSRMANYASGIGITAILVGLASASLKRRFGNQIVINISWALFIAMLLHAPSWL